MSVGILDVVEYLQDFLIIKDGGKVIFSTASDIISDEVIFGGFLEAIKGFYNLSLEDELLSIEGKKYRITFLLKEELEFIGISRSNINESRALKELQFFTDMFLTKYHDIMIKCNGTDVRKYKSFETYIKKTINEIVFGQLERCLIPHQV
jgi:hypothetical protein